MSENPKFNSVVIFQNYVFDLGKSLNPTEAARELLKTNFVRSSANYLTNDIEIALRFKKLLKLRKKAQQISQMCDYLENNSIIDLKSVLLCLTHKPNMIFYFLSKKRKSVVDNKLSGFDNKKYQQKIKDTIGFIDNNMVNNVQYLPNLHRYSDRLLFSPIYLSEVPFVRLELEPFYATINGEDLAIDVCLLIHRSGIAILTFYLVFNDPKSVDDIILFQSKNKPKVSRLEVVKPLISERMLKRLEQHPHSERFSSGLEWLNFENLKETDLSDVFELYKTAILSAISPSKVFLFFNFEKYRQNLNWVGYPIIFIRDIFPVCYTDEDFKTQFAHELSGLKYGFENWKWLKDEAIKNINCKDYALTKDYSFYITPGHSIVLYYSSCYQKHKELFEKEITDNDWLIRHFQSSSLLDLLLIQKWIINVLNRELKKIPYSINKLNRLRKNTILALDEFQTTTSSYGTAQDIIFEAQQTLGITQAYNTLTERFNNLDKLIEIEEDRRRTKRNFFYEIGLSFITLLLCLSSAKQMIDVISGWAIRPVKPNNLFLNRILIIFHNKLICFVKKDPDLVTLKLYLFLLILFFCLIFFTQIVFRRSKKRKIVIFDQSTSAKKTKFTWPVNLTLTATKKQDKKD